MRAERDEAVDIRAAHTFWAGSIFPFSFAGEGTNTRSPAKGLAGCPRRFTWTVRRLITLFGAVGPLNSRRAEQAGTAARSAAALLGEFGTRSGAAAEVWKTGDVATTEPLAANVALGAEVLIALGVTGYETGSAAVAADAGFFEIAFIVALNVAHALASASRDTDRAVFAGLTPATRGALAADLGSFTLIVVVAEELVFTDSSHAQVTRFAFVNDMSADAETAPEFEAFLVIGTAFIAGQMAVSDAGVRVCAAVREATVVIAIPAFTAATTGILTGLASRHRIERGNFVWGARSRVTSEFTIFSAFTIWQAKKAVGHDVSVDDHGVLVVRRG